MPPQKRRRFVPRRRRAPLRRWSQLRDFIRIIAYTGFAKNGRPQSVFLVGEPGHGKTELVNLFRKNQHIAFYSDMTMMTLLACLKQVQRGKITHIALPEFQKVIARRAAVSKNMLALLLEAMEEGVHTVGFGPQTHNLEGARIGVIAATTVRSMEQNPYLVSDLAMDSRAYFIDGRGTIEEVEEIKRRIAHGDMSSLKEQEIKHIPKKPVIVTIPEKIALGVNDWIKEMEEERIRVYGLRTYTRFLHTLRGVALMNERATVTRDDMDYLYSFRRLWLEPPPLPDEMGNATARGAGLGERDD